MTVLLIAGEILLSLALWTSTILQVDQFILPLSVSILEQVQYCGLICIEHAIPTGPSAELVRSLLSLSSSVQQLGYSRDGVKERCVAWTTFHHFVVTLIGNGWEESTMQALYDLAFLWKLGDLHGAKGVELCRLLDEKMNEKVRPSALF
jgi:hypothetical protein